MGAPGQVPCCLQGVMARPRLQGREFSCGVCVCVCVQRGRSNNVKHCVLDYNWVHVTVHCYCGLCSYDQAIQDLADCEGKREIVEKELRLVSKGVHSFLLKE